MSYLIGAAIIVAIILLVAMFKILGRVLQIEQRLATVETMTQCNSASINTIATESKIQDAKITKYAAEIVTLQCDVVALSMPPMTNRRWIAGLFSRGR